MPSDAALRAGAARTFLERGVHAFSLLRLVPTLYRAPSGCSFIISDHPVTRVNAFPYGDAGLSSPGVMVILPVAPHFALALHCPTIASRYEANLAVETDPAVRAHLLAYCHGFRTGSAIDVDEAMVRYLNARQVGQSRRYLYAAADDFAFAREMLAKHRELRSVETHVEFGGLGQGPPPKSTMPAGMHLVVFGTHDHCMLPIETLDEEDGGITAKTSNTELLELVAADQGMLRTELYVDGRARRGIGQAMIERFGEPSHGWFRVVHRDPGLRALAHAIEARRKG